MGHTCLSRIPREKIRVVVSSCYFQFQIRKPIIRTLTSYLCRSTCTPAVSLNNTGRKATRSGRETHRHISRILRYSLICALVYDLDFLDPLEYAIYSSHTGSKSDHSAQEQR